MERKSKKQLLYDELEGIKSIVNKNNVDYTIELIKWMNKQISMNTLYRNKQSEIKALKKAKKNIPKRLRPLIVERGDIWLTSLGINIGSEQCNDRPMFIIQNNINGAKSPNTIGIPLTKIENRQAPNEELTEEQLKEIEDNLRATEVLIKKDSTCSNEKDLDHHSILLCQNISTISKERLIHKISKVSSSEVWDKIEIAIKNSIGISSDDKV